MAIADTVQSINTAMEAATAAQQAGQYGEALRQVESALILMAQLPAESQLADERLKWQPERLQELCRYLKLRATETAPDASGGRGSLIRPTEITYKRG